MSLTKGNGFGGNITQPVIQGKKHILGIGINEYTGTGWRPLMNAAKDVQEVVDVLRTRYDFDQATVLLNTEATRNQIEDALYRFTDPAVLGTNDSLLIYYSGHGHLDHNDQGYWVPVNAQKEKISTYLPNSRIREIISAIKGRHVLLISDACFSGSFLTRGNSAPNLAMAEHERRMSRWAFCSGRHDEEVSDGKPGENSPFAKALLQELSLNGRSKINIALLADSVTNITRANYKQMPEASAIQDAGHGGGQFVFTLKEGIEVTEEPIPEPTTISGHETKSSTTTIVTPAPAPPPPPPPPTMNAEERATLKKEVQNFVASGRTDQAFQRLKEPIDTYFPDLNTELLTLSSRWEQLKRQERMGMIGFNEATPERNKINAGILGFVSEVLG
jgi:hypothetical protein